MWSIINFRMRSILYVVVNKTTTKNLRSTSQVQLQRYSLKFRRNWNYIEAGARQRESWKIFKIRDLTVIIQWRMYLFWIPNLRERHSKFGGNLDQRSTHRYGTSGDCSDDEMKHDVIRENMHSVWTSNSTAETKLVVSIMCYTILHRQFIADMAS